MRGSRSLLFGFFGSFVAGGLSACTLITDVDRERIPQPQQPTFPEIDAGPQPMDPGLDGGRPDASLPPLEDPLDAGGDAELDAGDAADAAPDAAADGG